MIEIDHSEPDILTLRPQGALSASDFDAVSKAVDTHGDKPLRPPNLVIELGGLPHWDSIGALERHVHFVRTHQKTVAKVALVGDGLLLSVLPELADQFVKTKIRHFPADKLADAKAWARSIADDPGHFEEIDGFPPDVIAVRAVGIITAQDYEDMLNPLVEDKLKSRKKIKCLVVMDQDYTAFSSDAIWSDTKFGVGHIRDFDRVAMVTNIRWIRNAAHLFVPLMPFPLEPSRFQSLMTPRNGSPVECEQRLERVRWSRQRLTLYIHVLRPLTWLGLM